MIADALGNEVDILGGHDVVGVVRQQAKDPSTDPVPRSFVDDADTEVAVRHREREVSELVRSPHQGFDAGGDATGVDERFGPFRNRGGGGGDPQLVP